MYLDFGLLLFCARFIPSTTIFQMVNGQAQQIFSLEDSILWLQKLKYSKEMCELKQRKR